MKNWQEVLKMEIMNPDVIAVGIASYTSSSISLALEAIEIVKKNNPALPIMWGGYHASASWKEILEEGLVDLVVRSAGEVATLKILQEIAQKKRFEECDFSTIDNVAYMVSGEAHSNPVSIQLPEETVPVLDYSLIDIKDMIPWQREECLHTAVTGVQVNALSVLKVLIPVANGQAFRQNEQFRISSIMLKNTEQLKLISLKLILQQTQKEF